MRIVIKPDGTVKTVYNDKLRPLNERLGSVSIKRASNVEFNNTTQQWEARLVETDELIASGPNREEVIKQEIAIIESRLHLV
jgi:hypothetical protein